ncbi:hypothetical protein BJX96DRAFT_153681 [Aspergillus floccosus]
MTPAEKMAGLSAMGGRHVGWIDQEPLDVSVWLLRLIISVHIVPGRVVTFLFGQAICCEKVNISYFMTKPHESFLVHRINWGDWSELLIHAKSSSRDDRTHPTWCPLAHERGNFNLPRRKLSWLTLSVHSRDVHGPVAEDSSSSSIATPITRSFGESNKGTRRKNSPQR